MLVYYEGTSIEEMKAFKVKTEWSQSHLSKRGDINLISVLGTNIANKIYGGDLKYLIGTDYQSWYNPSIFFIYEKSPTKLVTGAMKLAPLVWGPSAETCNNSEEGDLPCNSLRIETIPAESYTIRECRKRGLQAGILPSEAHSTLKDGISQDIFEALCSKNLTYTGKIVVSVIENYIKFRNSYTLSMLGINFSVRTGYIRSLDSTTNMEEPWKISLLEDINNTIKYFYGEDKCP